jgi:Leucine-rich repeat (LRR) protein
MPEPVAPRQEIWHDLQPVLDEELDRLADKYRMVILLCDLEGMTRKEAARQLRLPEGTVAGRLARARTKLAARLRQRGVTLSGGALATLLSQQAASASVPATVASTTIKTASLFAGANGATTTVAPKVAVLIKAVLSMMLLNKLKSVGTVLLLVGMLTLGGFLALQQSAVGHSGREKLSRLTSLPQGETIGVRGIGTGAEPNQVEKESGSKGTTITGRVVSEPGGKEIAGVPVTLWNAESGEHKTSRTDDKGAYFFANVKPGDYYKVWIEERPKMDAGLWSEGVVVRVQDRPVRADDLFRRLPQSVSGTVTDADSGKPVAGANMNFSTADGNWAAVGTDSEGRYCLFVTPRAVELSCHGTEERYYPADPKKVTIAAGKNLTGIDFKLKSGPQFSGEVVFPDGKPAKGLKVRVEIHWSPLDSEPRGGDVDSSGIGRDLRFRTDDAGHFRGYLRRPLREKEKQTVELKAIARLADGTMGGVAHGKTSSKEEYRITPLKVVLGKSSGVKVRIVNPDGKAITDAKLTASNVQAGWNIDLGGPAKHLGEGRYLMTNLIPGLDYYLAVQAPGHQTEAPPKAVVLKADETRDIGEIRLERVRQKPKSGAAIVPPLDDPWFAAVGAMPAEKQVQAVADMLKERNPGYDGTLWGHKIDGQGVVTEFGFYSKDVKDLAPVRALPGLQMLRCGGSGGTSQLSDLSTLQGQKLTGLDCALTSVSDLSPLKGMKLTLLYCFHTKVTDLSPLKGMPLTKLNFWSTGVSDLSPLKDMPLENLNLSWTPVSDLSPLKGMQLTALNCDDTKVSDLAPLKGIPLKNLRFGSTQVSDLTPLKGMPLMFLSCGSTKVSDLSPLKGMPLEELYLSNTRVSDLTPLKGMPLRVLHCDVTVGRDDQILRSIKTLTEINGKPVQEFWRELGFQGD